MLTYEREFAAVGFHRIAGIDEAGRGPLAGPVVAAAVILPWRQPIAGVRDSKVVPPAERERLYCQIIQSAVAVGVGMVEPRDIERVNVLQATIGAMEEAVSRLSIPPDALLVDAVPLRRLPLPQRAVIRGDALSYVIAAASIVAKVTRDHLMDDYHLRYPRYGFRLHKGYGTPAHLESLARYGACRIHRRTFRGVVPEGTPYAE